MTYSCVAALSIFLVSCSSKIPVSDNHKPIAVVNALESKQLSPAKPESSTFLTQVVSPQKEEKYAKLYKSISENRQFDIKSSSIEFLRANSSDYVALNSLAMYYYNIKQYEASILLLKKALTVKPNLSAIYNNLGLVELQKNNNRSALMMFRRALELDPQNVIAASNSGAIYIKNKDFLRALDSFNKLTDKSKMDIDSRNNYAIALMATGKHAEAAEIFSSILSKKSEHQYALQNYAILLIDKMGNYKQGLDLINRLKFVTSDEESQKLIKNLEIKAKAGLK